MKENNASGLGLVNHGINNSHRAARRRSAISRSISCAAALVLAQSAFATSASWTGGGTDTNWATTGNWTATPVPGTGDTATFNNGVSATENIFLNGPRTLAAMIITNGSPTTFTGGVSGVAASDRLTFTGGITVSAGAGTVTIGAASGGTIATYLAADQTFTNNSTAQLTFSTTLTSPASLGPKLLTMDGSGPVSVGTLSGSGSSVISVIKNGGGTWTIANPNWLGTTVVNNGTLQLSAAATTGTTLINASGTVLLASSSGLGTGIVTINGGTIGSVTSTRTPTNAFTFSGNVTLSGTGAATIFGGTVDLAGGVRTITVNDSNGLDTFNGIISNGGFTKAGSRTLTLGAANTYTGLTTISAGVLAWGVSNALATGDLTINGSTAVANLGNAAAHTDSVGTVTLDGGGTITSTAAGSVLTSTTSFEMKNGTLNPNVSLAGVGIPVNKSTSSTFTFSGTNSYTGGTNITGGTLQLNNAAALGSGPVSITGVRLALANNVNVTNAVNIGTNLGVTGHGLLEANDNATATVSGPITITDNAANGGHFAAGSNSTLVLASAITSSVPVTQRVGTVVYSGGGTGYSNLFVSGITTGAVPGTAIVGANDGIATSATVTLAVSGANSIFDLDGFNQTLVALTNNPLNAATTVVTNSGVGDSVLTLGNSGGSNTYNGTLQSGFANLGITKIGTGTQILAGNNNYTGNTNVSGGNLIFQSNLLSSSNVNVTGGQLQLSDSVTHTHVIDTGAVSVTGGSIDLADNKLITTTALATIQNYVAAGRNGGTWDAGGIITSESNAQGSTSLTTLAVANANDVGYNATRNFGGQSVTGAETLVMYTYAGDANLDGQVTGDDYFSIDAGFASAGGLTGYENGDFNYDGKINADDYFMIDKNYARQSLGVFPNVPALDGLAGVSAVPEPASLSLLSLGALAGLKRRRRNI